MDIKLVKTKQSNGETIYYRYEFADDSKKACGNIVLEKYERYNTDKFKEVYGLPSDKPVWNIELMRCIPEGKGYGSQLIQFVKDNMDCSFTVCPTSPAAKCFFRKHGITPF